AHPLAPPLRLDRPLCGRSSRLCRGTFELEHASRSLQLARPRRVLRHLQRGGTLLRGTANRLRLHAGEPRRARRPARYLVSGLSTPQHLHRRRVDLLHAGHRPGELSRECAAFRHLARSRRVRSRQLVVLWDRRLCPGPRPPDLLPTHPPPPPPPPPLPHP